MVSRRNNKKKDMLKISHRRSGTNRNIIKGPKAMPKRKHRPKSQVKSKTKKRPNVNTRKPKIIKSTSPSTKPVGYKFIGNRVHYRTKKGIKGNMPKGHVGMMRHWGLKEVKSL